MVTAEPGEGENVRVLGHYCFLDVRLSVVQEVVEGGGGCKMGNCWAQILQNFSSLTGMLEVEHHGSFLHCLQQWTAEKLADNFFTFGFAAA